MALQGRPTHASLAVLSRIALLPLVLFLSLSLSHAGKASYYKWIKATATFYGPPNGFGDNMGGACGYGNTGNRGFGVDTAAASQALWFKGATCGGCFQIQCASSKWCVPGKPRRVVTVTNNCPNNWALPNNAGGWCNYPRKHLDLAIPTFTALAQYQAGIIPVRIRRVPCQRTGNVKFSLYGNPWFVTVLVWNVAGSGDLRAIYARVNGGPWQALFRNWGASWTMAGGGFYGKSIDFRFMSGYTNEKLVLVSAVPSYWSFGGDYMSGTNYAIPSNVGSMLASD